MTLQKKCCCGKCFFGASSLDPDATACAHNQTEILKLKIPRPQYDNDRFVIAYGGTGCSCEGSYLKSTRCPESPTIEVEYDHFHPTGRTYTWFYERDYEVWPPCEGAPCCGYQNLTYDDAQCCQDGVLCFPTYRTWDGNDCSRYQGASIDPGTIPHLGSLSDSEDCSVGDNYWFLQDVANHSTTAKFNHWEVVGGVVTSVRPRSLEQTMLCVVHKEKWWVRDYNSLSQTDNPSASDIDNGASNCRTPKYWVFACSGIPLYTWEIKQLSSLTTTEQDDLIVKVTNGDPIPEAYADTLEADGILFAKDYGRTDGKVVKKTLKFEISSVPYTSIAYFYARPGGWTYVCQDWSSTPAELSDWPQIPRQFSESCDFGGDNDCFTASPIPGNDCECHFEGTIPAGCSGDPCDGDFADDCDPGVVTTCGTDGCARDTIIGNCKGCWVQFSQYFLKLPSASSQYGCNVSNNGYVCRVDPTGTCDFGLLPTGISHWIPSVVSGSYRSGNTSLSDLCCDGDGTIVISGADCPATTPLAADCDDPPVWGPGV